MIQEARLVQIASDLLDKSRAGQVVWQPVSSRTEGFAEKVVAVISTVRSRTRRIPRTFRVVLEHSRIYVDYCSPTSDPDYILFEVSRDDDTIVGSLVARDESPNWRLLEELHAEASRAALGWDEVLDDIDFALKKDDVIGTDKVMSSSEGVSASTFFEWASGEWLLKYTPKGGRTSQERLTIHSDGRYDVNGVPTFMLTNVEYDLEAKIVRFDKSRLERHARPVHQREELKIVSDDAMIGNRLGVPEHVLDYSRIPTSTEK